MVKWLSGALVKMLAEFETWFQRTWLGQSEWPLLPSVSLSIEKRFFNICATLLTLDPYNPVSLPNSSQWSRAMNTIQIDFKNENNTRQLTDFSWKKNHIKGNPVYNLQWHFSCPLSFPVLLDLCCVTTFHWLCPPSPHLSALRPSTFSLSFPSYYYRCGLSFLSEPSYAASSSCHSQSQHHICPDTCLTDQQAREGIHWMTDLLISDGDGQSLRIFPCRHCLV